MLSRVAITFVLVLLSNIAIAQNSDVSHPLIQEEFRTWDYRLLLDCSVKYEITADVYESLSDDPDHFAAAIAEWELSHKAFLELARYAAFAQGLSEAELTTLYEEKTALIMQPVADARGGGNEALAGVVVGYMNDAKKSCTPYFEMIRTRMLAIEERVR